MILVNIKDSFPKDEEIARIVSWLNNKELMKNSEQRHIEHSLASQYIYLSRYETKDRYWTCWDAGILVGTVSAIIDTHNKVADVGILIGVPGFGYGKMFWRRACDELLYLDRLRKVEAGCMANNNAMMKICRDYNMSPEGRSTQHFLCDGVAIDLVHWGKLQ